MILTKMGALRISLTFKLLQLFLQICISNTENFEKYSLLTDKLCESASIDLGTARSVTSCAQYCSTVSACKSFFFVKTNKQCKGTTTILESTAGCISMPSSVYYKRIGYTTTSAVVSTTTTTAPVNYGSVCTVDSECTLSFTHCLENSCQCDAGYSYESNTGSGSCVEACSAYGTTYIYFPNMVLDVPVISEHPGVSLAQCKSYCSNSAELCRGFNFCAACGDLCRVKGDTPLTQPSKYFSMTSVDYYFRNCA